MAFKQLTLTLTGSAQALTTALAAGIEDVPVKQIGLQADSANANVVYFGDSAVGTPYAVNIPVPVTSVPHGPLILDFPVGANVRLSELYVKGTNTQKVHGWIVY